MDNGLANKSKRLATPPFEIKINTLVDIQVGDEICFRGSYDKLGQMHPLKTYIIVSIINNKPSTMKKMTYYTLQVKRIVYKQVA